MIQAESCPYVPLCERELAGPELSGEEQARLDRHLSSGCAECEARIEENLSGGGPAGDPRADVRRHLEGLVLGAVDEADEAMAAGRMAVLARVQDRLEREEARARRLVRRRHLRAVFYLTNVAAVLLLFVAYFGTLAAARLQRRAAQVLATRTEIQALAGALRDWARDHAERLPDDPARLLEALAAHRPQRASPYYTFSPDRLRRGRYLDDFGQPYRYRRAEDGRALLYSVGPNGEDDAGGADDLSVWIVPPDR